MDIATHAGTRTEYIAEWFDKLQMLNEISEQDYNYDFVKTVFLTSISSDTELTNTFSDVDVKGDDPEDINHLKIHMLNKASLFD